MGKAKRAEVAIDPPPITGEYLQVPLKSIKPQKEWNPRTVFDEEEMRQLVDDVTVHGIIEPLILRPNGDGFYVIAGERRLRAATILKMPAVPAIVRELSDSDAFEQTISENLTRANLHPIEEAEGFRRLREQYLMTPAEIARRTGKHSKYVECRLALTNLAPPIRQAALKPNSPLQVGHLLTIAQIGNASLQLEMLKAILHPQYSKDALSVKEAEKLLDQYQRPLSGAQFKLGDAKLVRKAPSCFECNYNTSLLSREVFPKKDICTNITCFQKKQRAAFVQLTSAKDSEYEAITDKRAEQIFNRWGDLAYNSGYLYLDKPVYDGSSKPKNYLTWFRKFDGEYAPKLYAAFNPYTHRIETLAVEKDAMEAIRKIKAKLNPNSQRELSSTTPAQRAAQKRQKMEQQSRKVAVSNLILFVKEHTYKTESRDDPRITRAILLSLTGYQLMDAVQKVATERGLSLSDSEKKEMPYKRREIMQKKLLDYAEGLNPQETLALILELTLFEANSYVGISDRHKVVAKLFDLDMGKFQKDALSELKAAEKEKAQKAKKKKPAKTQRAKAAPSEPEESDVEDEETSEGEIEEE